MADCSCPGPGWWFHRVPCSLSSPLAGIPGPGRPSHSMGQEADLPNLPWAVYPACAQRWRLPVLRAQCGEWGEAQGNSIVPVELEGSSGGWGDTLERTHSDLGPHAQGSPLTTSLPHPGNPATGACLPHPPPLQGLCTGVLWQEH